MSDRHCPAGNIECERFWRGVSGGLYCSQDKNSETTLSEFIENFEQCPWPSMQVLVENKLRLDVSPGSVNHIPYKQGFTAGIDAAIVKLREQIKEHYWHGMGETDYPFLFDALEALKGE